MAIRPHHIGICVTDLEASLRFWVDGMGFNTTMVTEVGNEWGRALEVPGEVQCTAHFLEKDGFEFELLHYRSPGSFGEASANRNHIGFTHLAVYVDDIDKEIEHLVSCGGTVLSDTRTKIGEGAYSMELVFLADPNGVRVELMKAGE